MGEGFLDPDGRVLCWRWELTVTLADGGGRASLLVDARRERSFDCLGVGSEALGAGSRVRLLWASWRRGSSSDSEVSLSTAVCFFRLRDCSFSLLVEAFRSSILGTRGDARVLDRSEPLQQKKEAQPLTNDDLTTEINDAEEDWSWVLG